MAIKGFKMQLKPGFAAVYKKRHDEIWEELKTVLHKRGIKEYAIFLDEESGMLFGYQKLEESIPKSEQKDMFILKKWWDYMADIMDVHPDNSPKILPLKEVFWLSNNTEASKP